MDRVHKATAAEEDAVKAFNEYIEEQEEAYGPLVDRVNKIKQRHKVLAALEIEAEEIKEWGNIIAYENNNKDQIYSQMSKWII